MPAFSRRLDLRRVTLPNSRGSVMSDANTNLSIRVCSFLENSITLLRKPQTVLGKKKIHICIDEKIPVPNLNYFSVQPCTKIAIT
jgi:hypothetical protein